MDSRPATTARRKTVAALLAAAWLGSAAAAPQAERELGMSVIGNTETPSSLAIVPWKAAAPGDLALHPVQRLIDTPLAPLERDVVLRELHQYRRMRQNPE